MRPKLNIKKKKKKKLFLSSTLSLLASVRLNKSGLTVSSSQKDEIHFSNVFFCFSIFLFVIRYTKPISGIGIGAQKYNAEVRVSRSDVDSHLVQLSDRLRHVRQVNIYNKTELLFRFFFFFLFFFVVCCICVQLSVVVVSLAPFLCVVYVVRDEICTVPCLLLKGSHHHLSSTRPLS